ncbi:MAG: DUF1232 domain-containing protein [Verrucomicrobia bacterium]|nr:DUF1232 domain-containing protein [Verrucomicrobiota bacterium]
MGEISDFVHRGAAKITPIDLERVHKNIPLLKLEFADLKDPHHPHLSEQLGFLADLVEDFAEGMLEDIPYFTIAEAVFALVYAHRQIDLIPDSLPEYGHSDDSAVVRAVLIENQRYFSKYAVDQGKEWEEVSTEA